MARICVIRQFYYPLDVRVRREVGALVMDGHEVDVICLQRSNEPACERQGRVTIYRIPIGRSAGRLGYLFRYAAFFAIATLRVAALQLRRRYDLVQVNSMPDMLVFAAIVPRLLGARVLLDLHECMPEFYAVKFQTGLRHPLVRLVAWMEQAAIQFADFAITCTDQMREAFEARGANADKLAVIMNSANEEEFDPRRYPARTPVPGEFRIICHGSIERRYGIDTVLRAMALLRDEIPGLRLDIYGQGSAVAEMQALIQTLGLTAQVHMPGHFVPMEEVLQAIASADAGVVAIRRDIFRDLTQCNKMFEFITMRKPAIVSRTRSVEASFDDSCFQMFTSGDERDLARAIRELRQDPELGRRLVSRAAQVNEPYRWPYQRDRYQQVVQTLLVSRKAVAVEEQPELEPR